MGRRGTDAATALARCGGIASPAELRRAGCNWRRLNTAASDAAIGTTPSGLLYLAGTPWPDLLAREYRGAVACVTAAAGYGAAVWNPTGAVHLAVATSRTRPQWPGAPPVVVHRSRGAVSGTVPLVRALRHVAHCLAPLEALVVFESCVVRGLVHADELDALCRGPGSRRIRALADRIDPAAQSPAETLARAVLENSGRRVRSQIHVPGMGHADLEVDGVLLVEIDGRTYHSDARGFEEDRRRWNAASRGRRHLIRIPASWVLRTPWRVVEEVDAWFNAALPQA